MLITLNLVAPYAGAWIEAVTLDATQIIAIVAPYAGAWMETRLAASSSFAL